MKALSSPSQTSTPPKTLIPSSTYISSLDKSIYWDWNLVISIMSSPTPIQPFQYHPISFVSPISDTTHTHTNSSLHTSRLRRLSTYLKNAVTLEDTATAWRRESVISDHGNVQKEVSRRSSTSEEENSRLLAWRRGSEEGFWRKYGVEGRRKSSVNEEGEAQVERRGSLGRAMGKGKWRKMSWVGRE